jgi:DNA-directed RNA polymerase subunit RPC12/RpoP
MSNVWVVGSDDLIWLEPLFAFDSREEAETYINSQNHPDLFSMAEAEMIHTVPPRMELPESKYRCSACKTQCKPTYDIIRAGNATYDNPWCDVCGDRIVVEKGEET